MINNLLVITDQEDSNTFALEKACSIAAPFDARITVVSCISSSDAGNNEASLAEARHQLQSTVEAIFNKTDTTTLVLVTDDISSTLTQECRSRQIDLVVKTGHRSERLFYTPLDWQLIRHLPCPVLIATEKKWIGRSKVIATVDIGDDNPIQSQLNQDVLQWANQWAKVNDDTLAVSYIIPVSEVLNDMDIIDANRVENRRKPQLTQDMLALTTKLNIENPDICIEAGDPHKEIPSLASKKKADLVVLGSVGRTGLKGLLVGNTAEQVLKNMHTDVLIVRAKPQ